MEFLADVIEYTVWAATIMALAIGVMLSVVGLSLLGEKLGRSIARITRKDNI